MTLVAIGGGPAGGSATELAAFFDYMSGWGMRFILGATVQAAVPRSEDFLDVTLTAGEQLSVDTILVGVGRTHGLRVLPATTHIEGQRRPP